MPEAIRIDKWLWAVRIFKTRSIATEACKKGQVIINDIQVKPSRIPKTGDVIKVRKVPIYRHYKVLALIEKRVGAPDVANYMIDVTPAEELALLDMQKNMKWIVRDRGTGRPTKKERRDIDDFFTND